MTTTPAGAAPTGAGVGEVGSSVSLPPLTVKPLMASAVGSTTQSVVPSGARRASSGVPAALTSQLLQSVLLAEGRVGPYNGIELGNAAGLSGLLARIEASPLRIQHVAPGTTAYRFLV